MIKAVKLRQFLEWEVPLRVEFDELWDKNVGNALTLKNAAYPLTRDDATQPIISPDGKHVMYIALPAPDRNELWVSDINGDNKTKNLPLEKF